mgnify:CR=1 FL=1
METPISLNVPAFKRKRSIAAKERHIENVVPRKRARRAPRRRARPEPAYEEMTSNIPITDNFPSQELFEEPILRQVRESDVREMQICGQCEGYFDKIEVAVIQLTSVLHTGDTILFETTEGLFEQSVKSMQINRRDVNMARSGSDIGLKVARTPKVGGNVYKVI